MAHHRLVRHRFDPACGFDGGRLYDPAEVAALRAVADAARVYVRMLADPFGGSAIPELDALERALDAAQP